VCRLRVGRVDGVMVSAPQKSMKSGEIEYG